MGAYVTAGASAAGVREPGGPGHWTSEIQPEAHITMLELRAVRSWPSGRSCRSSLASRSIGNSDSERGAEAVQRHNGGLWHWLSVQLQQPHYLTTMLSLATILSLATWWQLVNARLQHFLPSRNFRRIRSRETSVLATVPRTINCKSTFVRISEDCMTQIFKCNVKALAPLSCTWHHVFFPTNVRSQTQQ